MKLKGLLAGVDCAEDCPCERADLARRLKLAVEAIDGMNEAMLGMLLTLDPRSSVGERMWIQKDKMQAARAEIEEPSKQ